MGIFQIHTVQHLHTIWQTLTVPHAIDANEARREYMTKVISLIMGIVAFGLTVIFGIGWGFGVFPVDSLLVTLAMTLIFSGGWWLSYRGYWNVAGYIPPIVIFLSAAYGNWIGGSGAPAMVLYVLAIVLTAILQNERTHWITLICCTGSYIGIGWMTQAGYITQLRFPETAFANRMVIVAGGYISVTSLLWFLVSQFRLALKRSHAYADQLAAANQDLEQEIAERRKVEGSLTREHNQLRTLIDKVPDYIYFKDTESRFLLGNISVAQIMGVVTSDELVGKTDFDFYPQDLAAQYHADEQDVIRSGHPLVNREEPLIDPYGNRIWTLTTKVPLQDNDGNITGLVGIGRDITERKQAEEALRESEERFATFMEYLPVNVTIKDHESRFLYANKHMRDLFDPALWSGKTASEYFPPEIAEKVLATDRRALEDGPLVFEEAIPFISGEIRAFETRKFPIKCEEKPDLIGIISLDITERKRVEEKIRKLNETLEERVKQRTAELEFLNQELRSFAYIVSHDLKAPLRNINQIAHWLSEDYADAFDEEGRKMIGLLMGRVKRMDRLIKDILDYSRIGRVVGQNFALDLNLLVKEVIDLLAPPPQIHIHIEQPLPTVMGDRSRLEQIFQNLLSNAIKFMDKAEGEIRIRSVDEGQFWQFSVADNGPGIEKNHHERIFQIFQTLSPRDAPENTGIGLSIVKKIVEFYGGKIWLESTPGKGCVFSFSLAKRSGLQE